MSSPRTRSRSPQSARSRSKSHTPDRVKAAVEAEEKRKKAEEKGVDTSEESDAGSENAYEREEGEEEDEETSGSGNEQDEGEDQDDEEEEGEVASPFQNEPSPEPSNTNGQAHAEAPPPLPEGPPPEDAAEDDGWTPVWDETYQAYYFFNHHTSETTWTNPRVPTESLPLNPTTIDPTTADSMPVPDSTRIQYNPAIHGDYDPTAPYAAQPAEEEYVSRAAFNRFTGKFQGANGKAPENYNDENKSRRQMEFYFDVDAAASSHDGRSLKAERQTRKLTRKEVKAFQEKRRARKEEKRKAWLRD